jgi:glycosyltransferase involved in cell wall biosynthesis
MSGRPYRVAVIALHPIQYQAGLWRAMASHPRLDVQVFYLDSVGVDGTVDPTMRAELRWDMPLLDGYRHEFLRNLSVFRFTPVVHRINPSVVPRLLRGRYDAVMLHGHLTLSNWLALVAGRCRRSRLIFRGEGTLLGIDLRKRSPLRSIAKLVSATFLGSCDAVAYSSQDNRSYLLSRGAAPERLFPMPCAVDNELLDRLAALAASRAEFRRRYGIPEAAVLVLSIGRFLELKRMQDCIRALVVPPLRGRADVRLALAGDGPERERLEREAGLPGLEDRVHFLGFLNQQALVEAMLGSDLFVLASSIDRSPKALSEALYLQLPVVCSDRVGTAAELVEPSSNGFIYPCGDVSALAARISEALEDPARRQAMGQRSREIAMRNDFGAGVESLVRKLDELAGEWG